MRNSSHVLVPRDSMISTSTHLNIFHVGKDLENVKESRHSSFRKQSVRSAT